MKDKFLAFCPLLSFYPLDFRLYPFSYRLVSGKIHPLWISPTIAFSEKP